MPDRDRNEPKIEIVNIETVQRGSRGGKRPGAGRPPTQLRVALPKDTYKRLLEFARAMGQTPERTVENLIIAHMEVKPRPYPDAKKAEQN